MNDKATYTYNEDNAKCSIVCPFCGCVTPCRIGDNKCVKCEATIRIIGGDDVEPKR